MRVAAKAHLDFRSRPGKQAKPSAGTSFGGTWPVVMSALILCSLGPEPALRLADSALGGGL